MASTVIKRLFPMRIDELPVIGGYIYGSLVRDVAAFTPYTDFNVPFPLNYSTQLGLVQDAVSPEVLISQMKLVTFNLLNSVFKLRDDVNKAEIYFISAGATLNVLPKDMGQRLVRKGINRGDVEALVGAMRTMNAKILSNSAALIAKGFTLLMQDALVTKTNNINTANNLQNTLREQRSGVTEANIILYNGFWTTYLSPTAKTGRLIYKVGSKARAKDYTVTYLVKRGRNDEKETWVFGKVMDMGVGVDKAKVKLMPVDGGRTKTVYTDKAGSYVVKGMRATDYNLVVTKGALVKVTAISVATRVHLEVNVVLG